MIYPSSIEHKIGFDVVRRIIAEGCVSPQGRALAKEVMCWSSDRAAVCDELARVAEMAGVLSSEKSLQLAGIVDATPWLHKIEVEGMFIDIAELRAISLSLKVASSIKAYFEQGDSESPDSYARRYPLLSELASQLEAAPEVVRAIAAIIDDSGNVRDNASPELARIRGEMATIARRISSAMRKVVSKGIADGILDSDTSPSVRDGRLVIPVAPMHKRAITGIVHDQSASGKTIFIEPAEIVELSNHSRELEIDERREIIRLLIELADKIRPRVPELYITYELLGRFDFIASKAKFAIDTDARMPRIADKSGFEWRRAVHPALMLHLRANGREIVPLDIRLGMGEKEGRIVVISGPNAGGKSVALKTVAIVQYMAQCGVLPTVADGSSLMLMENIFIDIGDDQSIDDDLSTYSSHLRNMKFFLANGNDRTLFLADEMGSGTEPQIGGALAQALLEAFNNKGMWGVVTTHYQNLKAFADETPGLINASMLYDRQKMAPLFKLNIGHPGSSFAIEIARNTGIPAEIIDKAGEIVGSDYINIDKYLLDIARDKRYWENKRENIRQRNKHLEETILRIENDADDLRSRRREIIEQAREEARRIVDESNAAVERTIREIREAQADREATRQIRQLLAEHRRELDAEHSDKDMAMPRSVKKIKSKKPKASAPKPVATPESKLEVGSNVLLDGNGEVGTIIEISGNKASVAFGALKMTVPLNRLTATIRQPRRQRPDKTSSAINNSHRTRQLNFKPELDVRGFRADEALQAITYFLDDAVQFSIGRVRILHGTGTGALRQATREYLATHPSVSSYHDEDVRFGGAGITVVNLA